MKISVNWLKEYTKMDLPIIDLVEMIGAQLGAVEEVIDLGAKYKGILTAKVVSCLDHPNADKLHVCLIDDAGMVKDVPRNDDGYIQIVCGANNVAIGQTVVWLPPGVVVPETYASSEPFKLTAKELRGVLSQGMIASNRELDFGDEHEGIVVLDQEVKPGVPITEALGLKDHIIDIENKMFTHRPDCFGMLGVSREVAGIQGLKFTSPDWYLNNYSAAEEGSPIQKLEVINEVPELVPRFIATTIDNIKIKSSPIWLQTVLGRLAVKPINNVVDITNYMMLLTGQPLHAYDYHKVTKANSDNIARIIVRQPKDGEKLVLIGSKPITLNSKISSAIIATDQQAIGLGGVMGGVDTEVDENTTSIILECANFDKYSIRKTSMTYGLFSDAVTRFSKGQSPLQNDKVLFETIKMLKDLAGGRVSSKVIDHHNLKGLNKVSVTPEFINIRLGLNLSAEKVAELLQNVEFVVENKADELEISLPFWRTDIEIAEDIVEEVGRLYGYDKLPVKLPSRSLKPAKKDQGLELKRQIRQILSSAGANELLTYSFVHGNLIDKVGQNRDLAYRLSNALSPDLQFYRMSLLPSLLDRVHSNIKSGHGQFGLYEIGKAHIKNWLDKENLPKEEDRLAFVFAADGKLTQKYLGAAYYQSAVYLDELLSRIGVDYEIKTPISPESAINQQMSVYLNKNRSAIIVNKADNQLIGVIGEFKANVRQALKLPEFCSGFEIYLDVLADNRGKTYKPLSKYPKVEQDISLKVSKDINFAQIDKLIKQQLGQLLDSNTYFEVLPLDVYQAQEVDFKHFTFRVIVLSYEKTLKSKDVNDLLDKVAQKAKVEISATRL